MLDARDHRGDFGQAYVRALASAAGLLVRVHDVDRDGVDLGFRFPGRANGLVVPALEAQVGSWPQNARTRSPAEWHFDGLDEVRFTRLAGDDFTVPRFLFLVRVPSDNSARAAFRTEGMLLRHLAFYCSLRHESPIENPDPRRRRSVLVPKANVLTTRSLLNLVGSVQPSARSAV
ncbi:DUF4365 domain-containing protein [Umezawaea beigongshangensis]|uniref:DUF4365 domain-containing protein n=1 Tax=Umezawaea beigongshangensis TaxID=2780383 RepID=UPI0018F1A409|nr:DUF4365 domain-containing protein [Umezawaea beigongshangensis]